MTQEEQVSASKKFGQHVKPRLTSPKWVLPPSLLDDILVLDECVYELQEITDKLEYIMVQHTDVLYAIAHNQVVLENRINHIQTLLTTYFTEVGQKLGDLTLLGSLAH